jgi:hypothetical protein
LLLVGSCLKLLYRVQHYMRFLSNKVAFLDHSG